jgi:hypothetical protein
MEHVYCSFSFLSFLLLLEDEVGDVQDDDNVDSARTGGGGDDVISKNGIGKWMNRGKSRVDGWIKMNELQVF